MQPSQHHKASSSSPIGHLPQATVVNSAIHYAGLPAAQSLPQQIHGQPLQQVQNVIAANGSQTANMQTLHGHHPMQVNFGSPSESGHFYYNNIDQAPQNFRNVHHPQFGLNHAAIFPAQAHVYQQQNQANQQGRQFVLQPGRIPSQREEQKNLRLMETHFQQSRMIGHQQIPYDIHYEYYQPMRISSYEQCAQFAAGEGVIGMQESNTFQRNSLGVLGSPNTNSTSQKTRGTGSNQRSSATRGGKQQMSTSATTAWDSFQTGIGANNRGNERGSGSVQTRYDLNQQFPSWMAFVDQNSNKLASTAKKENNFAKIKNFWPDATDTPQRNKQSMSPKTLQNTEQRKISSPLVQDNIKFAMLNHPGMMTAEKPVGKHFKRTRVNTKTPSSKLTTIILSAPKMSWDFAQKLTGDFDQVVTSDQIKNCDMKLDLNQIHVKLSTVEAASKVFDHYNNLIFLDKLVTAQYEKSSSIIASPQTGTMPSSSSPPQVNSQMLRANPQGNHYSLKDISQEGGAMAPLYQYQQQQMQQSNDLQQQWVAAQRYPTFNQFYLSKQNSGSSMNLDNSQGQSNGKDPISPRMRQAICPCCQNGHAKMLLRKSCSSLSSPNEYLIPSGGSSSFGGNSLMQKLNHSPNQNQTRTLDCETRASTLGMNHHEHYSSGNIGALMYRHNRHSSMLLQGPDPTYPKSNKKSSTITKSASGSQNASSTSAQRGIAGLNRGNDEPVKIELVKQAKDLRTYLHVKNIPCTYSKKQLKEEINRCHKGRYYTIDPIVDKKHDSEKTMTTNKGYFFIGFKHPLFVVDFYEQYQGKILEPNFQKNKIAIYYGHNPKKENHGNHKLDKDMFLMGELRMIIEKYDIKTPLENFNVQMIQPLVHCPSLASANFIPAASSELMQKNQRVQNSLCASPSDTIAEEDYKDQDTMEPQERSETRE